MSETFEQRRDRILRKELLNVLNLTRGNSPTGELSGDRLFAETEIGLSGDMSFADDSHFLRLCKDLVNLSLIGGRDKGTRERHQMFSPRHMAFAITALGTQLLEKQIAPIKGVDDERAFE
jgi:hypothetical protein